MEAYLDNSATTRVLDSVRDIVIEAMQVNYGNPSSMHTKGVDAERYVRDAKEIIAKTLKVSEKEIVFTSGGTESNNMAIIGSVIANKRNGNHIITTSIEHASVSNTMKFLEEEGYRVTYLSVDENGLVDLEQLKEAICEDTILVSIMYVNNEIGAVEPIEEIAKIIKEKNEKTLFHVDAIQAYGKYKIYPKKIGIDMLSVSGHKIHGPKGTGFLYIRDKVKVRPLILGGGQQKGMRSGTENVPGVAGIAKAAQCAYEDYDAKISRLYDLKSHFISRVSEIDDVKINGLTGTDSAPHIISVSFKNIRSEVLLHSLEDKNIYVSAGSACASNKPAVSATLKSIGVAKEMLDSTIRFSFSSETTKEEVDYAIDSLNEIVPILRRYTRG